MRIRCWVRAISSRCTRVDQLVELAAEVAQPHARLAQLLLAAGAAPARRGPLGGGEGDRLLEPGQHDARRRGRRPRRPAPRASSCSRRAIACGAGLALGAGRARAARRRGRGARGRAPRWCAAPAGPPSRRRGRRGPPPPAARARRCRAPPRARPRPRPAATPARRGPRGPCRGPPAAAAMASVEARGLGPGVAGLGAVLAELLGDGGQGGVGLVQLGQRDVDAPPGLLALALEGGDVEAEPLERVGGRGELLGGLVDGRLHLDQARLARGAAGGEVGAEQVAVAGHRGDVGRVADQRPRRGEVVDDRDAGEQPRQGGPQLGGALHHVDGVRRPGRTGRRATARGVDLVAPPSRIPARPRSSSLRWPIAPSAASTSRTATASAALPSAAATAAS